MNILLGFGLKLYSSKNDVVLKSFCNNFLLLINKVGFKVSLHFEGLFVLFKLRYYSCILSWKLWELTKFYEVTKSFFVMLDSKQTLLCKTYIPYLFLYMHLKYKFENNKKTTSIVLHLKYNF